MVTKKKKIIVLSVMMGLLVLTGFLNVTLNQSNDEVVNTSGTVTSANFFSTYRTDRDVARSQEKLYYQAILDSSNTTSDERTAAQTALANIASTIEKELYLEGNIKVKGYDDVIVSMTDNFVNVMVKASELNDAQVAQIVQVVQDQTKKSIDNIKIIPVV
ncbi:MAG: SpoIIIAH-like family protein [Clostridia bacterium]|nr:SpoIIIAH-like family protein [Clostridia bacterium]